MRRAGAIGSRLPSAAQKRARERAKIGPMTRWDDVVNDVQQIADDDIGELESLRAALNDGAYLFHVILAAYSSPVEAVRAISVMPADELRVVVLHCAFDAISED
jgi:hypothetical protein